MSRKTSGFSEAFNRTPIPLSGWVVRLVFNLFLVGYTIWGFSSDLFAKYDVKGNAFWVLLVAISVALFLHKKPVRGLRVAPKRKGDPVRAHESPSPVSTSRRVSRTPEDTRQPSGTVVCPHCGNAVLRNVRQGERSIAAHEAYAGSMVAGPAWEFSDAYPDKRGRYTVVCPACGNAFTFK